MTWTLLLVTVVVLGVALAVAVQRRRDLAAMARALDVRDRAIRDGSDEAKLQHPIVDLSRCLGCATCVAVCPENGVIEIVHGQAVVVNGARCVGVSACERECPVGAIAVTIANADTRTDVPNITSRFEAVGVSGLFLAGEVTAHALVKTAIEHGTAVAGTVAERTHQLGRAPEGELDLLVVGAGPAGLACSLEAKRHGLTFVTIDQADAPGGTVAKYPRRKLVISEPVDLPLYGRLKRSAYTKEQLIALWQQIAQQHALPFRGGEVLTDVTRDESGRFVVQTNRRRYVARHVCLALGRRGVPNKLGVPGEDLAKVSYSLLDAGSYQGRRILVVGGGDSAVETAVALAQQPGNEVVLSYRKQSFFRIREENERRLAEAVDAGRLEVLYGTRVVEISDELVELEHEQQHGAAHAAGGAATAVAAAPPRIRLPNDEVFVMAGGMPPFELLEASGVSFDPALRDVPEPEGERGTGLTTALSAALGLTLGTLLWALWHSDYYLLPLIERPAHDSHGFLRPGRAFGLAMGIAAVACIVVNLLYLLRRSQKLGLRFGSLRTWMTSHVATGVLAVMCALLHAAMAPRDTVGGHAFEALAVLLLTGAIGRYFYAHVPRAANGRELALDEVKSHLEAVDAEWSTEHREFGERVRSEVGALVDQRQWGGSFVGRVFGLLGLRLDLRRVLARLRAEGRVAGIPDAHIASVTSLATRAHRAALWAAHFEDLRAVVATWRWLHRWVAALMVLLVVIHIVYALSYGASYGEVSR